MISRFFFLVLNILLGYILGYSQTEITYRVELKNNPNVSKEILQMLFGGKISVENQSISWKPNPKELIAVNSLGLATSMIDTVLNYNIGDSKFALSILKSFVIDEEGNAMSSNADVPTMSLALFEVESDRLNLLAFNKLVCQKGNMNMFPKLNVLQLGVNLMALSIEEEEHKDLDLFTTFYSLSPWELGREVMSLPIWRIHEYSDNPVFQKATFELKKPANIESEYFDVNVNYQLVRQKESREIIIKKWNSNYQYDGRRWEKI
jgi:uncharacterized protein YneF (UPF0154 family)